MFASVKRFAAACALLGTLRKTRAAATQNAMRRFSAHLVTLLTTFTQALANSAAKDAREKTLR